MAGRATLVESSVRLTIAQLAHHELRHEPARRLMVPNQTLGMALRGGSRPFVAVPLLHLERLFM
jgi:hypothetical protein